MALLRCTGPVGRNVGCKLHTKSAEDISNERTRLLHFLTPRSRVLLERPTGSQLVKKKNPHILRNPKFHYLIHKSPSPDPILSYINPINAPTTHFLKIYLNIILPSTPGPSRCSFSLRFPHQNPLYTSTLPHSCYTPVHLILIDLITRPHYVVFTTPLSPRPS